MMTDFVIQLLRRTCDDDVAALAAEMPLPPWLLEGT